ncbi:MAG: HNH endonuclease [Xenococcaceae cyanobacterium]
MPIDSSRYPDNWSEISRSVKEKAKWKCHRCGRQCLKPEEKRDRDSRSEWMKKTLSVPECQLQPRR